MNAPFSLTTRETVRAVDLGDPNEAARVEACCAAHPEASPFHLPAWLQAVEQGTGNRAHALVLERAGEIAAYLPLTEVHSPVFGRVLASTGFAVDGGVLAPNAQDASTLCAAAEELATRTACASIELRGGPVSDDREGWALQTDSHCGFVCDLAGDDEAQLTAIPRKQRAEVRKSLKLPLEVTTGSDERHRAAHYATYAQSVRNLGTPVFPRALFDAVLDRFGEAADILVVWHENAPLAAVLSLYHKGAVMPYWGGGTWDARHLRGNERMYYALMCHARERGCTRFDFGRSKTGSGAYSFKKNWGFEPEPLTYAKWTAPGAEARDADPTSSKHARRIAIWQRLPLPVANRLGPLIARGLG